MSNKLIITHEYNSKIMFHAILVVFWLFFPIISILPISLYLAVTKTSKSDIYFYLGLLALVPALINSTKIPVSDLKVNYEAFDVLYEKGVIYFFKFSEARDIFFYGVSYIMSKIVFGNNNLILLLWTFIIYLNCFLSLFEFAKNDKTQCKWLLIACIYITLFWGISISVSGHLLRQFVAMSFILLSLTKFNNGSKVYIIYLIFGCLSHFSMIIFVLFFILSKIKISILKIAFPVIILLSLVLGESNTLPLLTDYLPESLRTKAIIYHTKNDGESSSFYLVIFSLAAIFFTIKAGTEKDRYYFWFVYICYLALLLFFRNNALLYLRYHYCYKFFAVLILYKILIFSYRTLVLKYFVILFSFPFIVYVTFYFFKDIIYCPWQYITNEPFSLCLTSVFDYLSFSFGKFISTFLLFISSIYFIFKYFRLRKIKLGYG